MLIIKTPYSVLCYINTFERGYVLVWVAYDIERAFVMKILLAAPLRRQNISITSLFLYREFSMKSDVVLVSILPQVKSPFDSEAWERYWNAQLCKTEGISDRHLLSRSNFTYYIIRDQVAYHFIK